MWRRTIHRTPQSATSSRTQMTTLYLDESRLEIQLEADAIVCRQAQQCIATLPLTGVTRILLRSSATLEASLPRELQRRGIGLVFLGGRQRAPGLMLPSEPGDSRRRLVQARTSADWAFRRRWARQLVSRKLQHQHDLLLELRQRYLRAHYPLTQSLRHLHDAIARAESAPGLRSLRGVEGAAAAAYFSGLRAVVPRSLSFKARNRRPPRDPFNVLLSLAYTLVTAELQTALLVAGLDPAVGYYHKPAFARPSLACDLVEPLRPLADQFCLQQVAGQTLTADHFQTHGEACILGPAGRQRFYHAWRKHAAQRRPALAHEIDHLLHELESTADANVNTDSQWRRLSGQLAQSREATPPF